jgi:hypothetical protein
MSAYWPPGGGAMMVSGAWNFGSVAMVVILSVP